MMTVTRIFNEFFIITEDGINLFSRSSSGEQQENMDMISGFLSALNTFAKTERGESMKELTLEQTTFAFEKSEHLIYVMTSGEPKARQLLKLFLEKIIDVFGSMFETDFANFMGDVAPFEKFGMFSRRSSSIAPWTRPMPNSKDSPRTICYNQFPSYPRIRARSSSRKQNNT